MKKKVIIISFLLITIILLTSFKKEVKTNNFVNNEINKKNNSLLSMMLETNIGSGEYEVSNDSSWPSSGYQFNAELSKCENGGVIVWNEDTGAISVRVSKTDKCYAYFDRLPPDVSVSITNRPTTYGKIGNINCSGASASFNQKYNRIEVSSIDNKYTSCNLNYTDSTSKVNLATYISGLVGTTQGNGQVVSENGYRYEGKNPNNYIWFNNEYWRIIEVFDSNSHGQSGKNLVKIIRDDSLGGLSWDKSGINDWTTASLNKLLNGAYLNAQDGTDSGYCYISNNVTTNCDYTKKGIQSGYRNMIANVTWYLGGSSGSSATADAFYGYERGTTVYSGNATSTTGYIGLMYPSDYGYSVLASGCDRTTNLRFYSTLSCAGQSWLYGKGYEWTLTPNSSNSSDVFYLHAVGYVQYSAKIASAFRPVLYLDASVYKLDGDGSLNFPYIMGI